jgi:hypothetical protein
LFAVPIAVIGTQSRRNASIHPYGVGRNRSRGDFTERSYS